MTSAAADLDALRPWDAAGGRPVGRRDRVRDRGRGRRRPRPGTLEKTFRGLAGHRPPRVRRRDDHRPDARRPGAGRADRHPDRGLLPLDGVASATTSWPTSIATRPRSTTGSRRRSAAPTAARRRAKRKLEKALHELKTKGDKNPGRLKVAERGRRQAPRPPSSRASSALAQLERDRDTLAGARERRAETESSLAERRSLLEKARQAERLIRGTANAAGAVRALPPGRRRRRRAGRSPDDPPVAEPAARPRAGRRTGCGSLDATDPRPEGGPVRRDRGLVRGPAASRPGSRCPAGRDRARRPRAPASPPDRSCSRRPASLDLGPLPIRPRRHRRRDRRRPRLRRLVAPPGRPRPAAAARRRDRPAAARPVRDGGRAAPRPRRTPPSSSPGSGCRTSPRPRTLLARGEGPRRRIDRLTAQLDGLVGKEPPETLPALRDAAALEIEQKTSALEALGPIAKEPRARERLEVEVRDQETALERPATTRRTPAPGSSRTPSTPSRSPVTPSGSPPGASSWPRSQRRQRVYERTLREIERAEQATMKTATRYLEQRMVRDIAADHGRPLPPCAGRRQDARHRGSAPRRRATGSTSARSARAPSTSSTCPPASGWSGS